MMKGYKTWIAAGLAGVNKQFYIFSEKISGG